MKFIIVDLEASCWRHKGAQRNEIIEIGAVCVDEDKEVLEEFEQIIKPSINPILSDFCTELTTITQEMVDDAPTFPQALEAFLDWIDSFDDDYVLCSWGHYDRIQFKSDCELHDLDTEWLKPHISLKHQHGYICNLRRPMGMKSALKRDRIPLTGTHHRGIDDAKNIAKIFVEYYDYWDY